MEAMIRTVKKRLPERYYLNLKKALQPVYHSYFRILYHGSRYKYPCCGKHCRAFIPTKFKVREFTYGRCSFV